MEKVRIQFQKVEVKILRNMLAEQYRHRRRNLRYACKRVERGERDSVYYPIAQRTKNLKETARLLRKLHKHTGFPDRWDTL